MKRVIYNYLVRDREAGNIIETHFNSEQEVLEKIHEYESKDLQEGIFEPNFYEACARYEDGEIVPIG